MVAHCVGLVVAAHDLCWCLQAVVLSEDAINAIESAVVAILEEYDARLETGDADDVATLESLAAAIGLASQLDLRGCKKFVKSGPFRAVAVTRGDCVALAGRLKRLDPLLAFLLHPRCCLVKLDLYCQDETQR